jgi:hypothetical protein
LRSNCLLKRVIEGKIGAGKKGREDGEEDASGWEDNLKETIEYIIHNIYYILPIYYIYI